MGFSKQNVYNVLNGDQEITLPFLEAVTKALDMDMGYWFTENTKQTESNQSEKHSNYPSTNMLDKALVLVDLYKGLYDEAKAMLDSAEEKLSKYEGGRKKETGT